MPDIVYEATLEKGVRLRFALAVNRLVAIGNPLDKTHRTGVGKTLCEEQDAIVVEDIRESSFTIGRK